MKWKLVLLLILGAACVRLLPHPFNFTPLGALGLFGGAWFGRHRFALFIPFVALFLSDLVLNNVVYASQNTGGFVWFTSFSIYLAFACIVAIGFQLLNEKRNWIRIVSGALAASVLFFLITNFCVWYSGTMYSRTFSGLLLCYTAGIPFFWNTLAGDLFYAAVLFGSYSWFTKEHFQLATKRVRVNR